MERIWVLSPTSASATRPAEISSACKLLPTQPWLSSQSRYRAARPAVKALIRLVSPARGPHLQQENSRCDNAGPLTKWQPCVPIFWAFGARRPQYVVCQWVLTDSVAKTVHWVG